MSETAAARTLTDIAWAIGAQVVGDGTFVVRRVAHPLMAEAPDTLALAMEGGAERVLPRTKAGAAAVAESGVAALAGLRGGIVVKRPRYALAQLLELFDVPPVTAPGIHPSAIVDSTAAVEASASIGALCHIGPGARIGARTRLLAQVTVGAGAPVGERSAASPGHTVIAAPTLRPRGEPSCGFHSFRSATCTSKRRAMLHNESPRPMP